MSNAYNRTGFEESILSSEDDFEPYGWADEYPLRARQITDPIFVPRW